MAGAETEIFMRGLDRLFRSGTISGLDESALVDRFANRRDSAAFEAIVKRHGAMVWSVCRQTLRDPNDAADAFQATFLIFAARAGAIRRRDKLGGWLHGVAMRVSSRARRDLSRRAPLLVDIADASQGDHAESREQVALLHEELDRLPGKYRDPIILCHLEGCTHDEAAARLGWPVGTVRGRLSRGRDRLRERLTRRGMAGAFIGFESISPPMVLSERTIHAATASLGKTAAGLLSVQGATWLAWGVRAMMIKSWVLTGVVALGVISASGAGVFAFAWQEGSKKSGEARVEEKGVEPTVVKAGSQEKAAEIAVSAGKGEPDKGVGAPPAFSKQLELEAKVGTLRTEIDTRVKLILQIEEYIRQNEKYLLRMQSSEPSTSQRSGRAQEATQLDAVQQKEEDKRVRNNLEGIQTLKNDLVSAREKDRVDRAELVRLEDQLAALNNNERAEEIVQAVADLDVMTIDVEAVKDRWMKARSAVIEAELSIEQVNGLPPQFGLDDRKNRAEQKLNAFKVKEVASRDNYLKARLELARAQRRFDAMRQRSLPSANTPTGTPDIESRLSRIEQALERLEKKVK